MKIKRLSALVLALVLAMSFVTTASARFMGDVNNDGEVNSSDALLVLQYAVGSIEEIDIKAADMNGDGVINSSDALSILKVSVGSEGKVEMPEEKPEEPEEPEEYIPETAEEILAIYNNAVNKAVNEKAGYTKQRTTTVKKIDAGSYTSMAGGIVKDFLGEGTNDFTNAKGSAKHLKNSTLEVADLTQVKLEVRSDTYTVVLDLKDGTSSATKTSVKDSSPLAKSGLITGKSVTNDVDYINSLCIYSSITENKIKVEQISATTKNAQIVVVVEKETGKLLSYTASFEWDAEIKNLSVTLPPVKINKATGSAHTSVEFSDFKW